MLATLETWARRVWVERDLSAVDELRSPDARSHGLGMQTLLGPEQFKAFHRSLCTLLHDTNLVIDHHMQKDDWLVTLCTFTGRAADGREVAMNGAIHVRIVDGKIVEAYNHFDFLGLFVQLGLLPPDTFSRCMNGEPVTGHS
jgi:ketosteroid isomerase-like protein